MCRCAWQPTNGCWWIWSFPLNLGVGSYVIDVAGHRGPDEHHGLFFWRDEACKFDVENRTHPYFLGIARLPVRVSLQPASPAMLWMEPINDADLEVELRCVPGASPVRAEAGATIVVPIMLRNDSRHELSSYPPAPIVLSYHIADQDGNVVVFDGERTPLSAPIRPGEERGILMEVRVPARPGFYLLEPSLVQEGVRWFDHASHARAPRVHLQLQVASEHESGPERAM